MGEEEGEARLLEILSLVDDPYFKSDSKRCCLNTLSGILAAL